MASINKVILIGYVGDDPNVRHWENGGVSASLSIATSEYYNDKRTGERQTVTEWINLTANGPVAKNIERFVIKGTQLYVEGKLKTRTYEKDGQKKYITEVVVFSFQTLGPRGND